MHRRKILKRTLVWILSVYSMSIMIPAGYTDSDSFDTIEIIESKFKNGDLIFQSSYSSQSRAIKMATRSIYNHMGIIFFRQGKPFVLEALRTVRYTPLEQWIHRGIPESYRVKRLKNADRLLTNNTLYTLKKQAEIHLGKSYDSLFDWSDRRMYCSELVWKSYYQALKVKLGQLKPLHSFHLNNPAVKTIIEERYGSKVPYNRLVISPADMYKSDLLTSVNTREPTQTNAMTTDPD